jgi:hypothetical protein
VLKHLNLDEMVGLTSPWVSDATCKALFLSIPEIAALHPQVADLQAELGEARPLGAGRSEAMKKITEQATAVDVLHDALVRAVDSGLETDRLCSLARKPPELARAEQLEKAKGKLFPSGLSIINASLVAEYGNAERVGKLLAREPEITALLAEIPVRDGTLLQLTKRWIATGKKLRKLEQDRAALVAKEAHTPRDSAAVNRLRVDWIRLVSLVLANLEVSKANPQAIDHIRGPVFESSDRAGKRYDLPAAIASDETVDESVDEAMAETPSGA